MNTPLRPLALDNIDETSPQEVGDAGPDGVPEGAADAHVKILTSPMEPPQRRVDAHCMAGHIPYRDWCPHCVRGRGKNVAHKRGTGDHLVPMIGLDYAFLGAGAGRLRGPAKEAAHAKAIAEGIAPMLVLVDDSSGAIFSHIVPQKGIDYPMVVAVMGRVVENLDLLGYKRVIFRGDQEPSLGAFMAQLKVA